MVGGDVPNAIGAGERVLVALAVRRNRVVRQRDRVGSGVAGSGADAECGCLRVRARDDVRSDPRERVGVVRLRNRDRQRARVGVDPEQPAGRHARVCGEGEACRSGGDARVVRSGHGIRAGAVARAVEGDVDVVAGLSRRHEPGERGEGVPRIAALDPGLRIGRARRVYREGAARRWAVEECRPADERVARGVAGVGNRRRDRGGRVDLDRRLEGGHVPDVEDVESLVRLRQELRQGTPRGPLKILRRWDVGRSVAPSWWQFIEVEFGNVDLNHEVVHAYDTWRRSLPNYFTSPL